MDTWNQCCGLYEKMVAWKITLDILCSHLPLRTQDRLYSCKNTEFNPESILKCYYTLLQISFLLFILLIKTTLRISQKEDQICSCVILLQEKKKKPFGFIVLVFLKEYMKGIIWIFSSVWYFAVSHKYMIVFLLEQKINWLLEVV